MNRSHNGPTGSRPSSLVVVIALACCLVLLVVPSHGYSASGPKVFQADRGASFASSTKAYDSARRSILLAVPLLPLVTFPNPALARLDPVNKPELLPSEKGQFVVSSGVPVLSPGQTKSLSRTLERIEKSTGIKVRLLTQNYPVTPGLAIKDYFGLDSKYCLLIADDFTGVRPSASNYINFSASDDINLELPPAFLGRISSAFGNR